MLSSTNGTKTDSVDLSSFLTIIANYFDRSRVRISTQVFKVILSELSTLRIFYRFTSTSSTLLFIIPLVYSPDLTFVFKPQVVNLLENSVPLLTLWGSSLVSILSLSLGPRWCTLNQTPFHQAFPLIPLISSLSVLRIVRYNIVVCRILTITNCFSLELKSEFGALNESNRVPNGVLVPTLSVTKVITDNGTVLLSRPVRNLPVKLHPRTVDIQT